VAGFRKVVKAASHRRLYRRFSSQTLVNGEQSSANEQNQRGENYLRPQPLCYRFSASICPPAPHTYPFVSASRLFNRSNSPPGSSVKCSSVLLFAATRTSSS
jgi:hypothetical protein